jgi:hypothetical protein
MAMRVLAITTLCLAFTVGCKKTSPSAAVKDYPGDGTTTDEVSVEQLEGLKTKADALDVETGEVTELAPVTDVDQSGALPLYEGETPAPAEAAPEAAPVADGQPFTAADFTQAQADLAEVQRTFDSLEEAPKLSLSDTGRRRLDPSQQTQAKDQIDKLRMLQQKINNALANKGRRPNTPNGPNAPNNAPQAGVCACVYQPGMCILMRGNVVISRSPEPDQTVCARFACSRTGGRFRDELNGAPCAGAQVQQQFAPNGQPQYQPNGQPPFPSGPGAPAGNGQVVRNGLPGSNTQAVPCTCAQTATGCALQRQGRAIPVPFNGVNCASSCSAAAAANGCTY